MRSAKYGYFTVQYGRRAGTDLITRWVKVDQFGITRYVEKRVKNPATIPGVIQVDLWKIGMVSHMTTPTHNIRSSTRAEYKKRLSEAIKFLL